MEGQKEMKIQKMINDLFEYVNKRLLSLKPFFIKVMVKPVKSIKDYFDRLFRVLANDTHKNLLKRFNIKYNEINFEAVITKYNFKKRIDNHLLKLQKKINIIFKNVSREFKLNIKQISTKFEKYVKKSSAELKKGFKTFYRRIRFIKNQESHRIKENVKSITAKIINKKVRVGLEWISKGDKKVRKEHTILDGQIRTISGTFNYHGYETKFPGGFGISRLDLGCRCKTRIVRL